MTNGLRLMMASAVTAAMVAVSLGGCADIRKLTYPKGFVYLDNAEIESRMRGMGESIERLEKLIISSADSKQADRESVLGELKTLEAIARSLEAGDKGTNHPVIDDHINRFIDDIEQAKLFATETPPSYYYAGKLTGSCTSCHSFR